MPPPLQTINTPPSAPSKRQRVQDTKNASGEPGLGGYISQRGGGDDELPPSPSIRMPAFLNQTKAEISKLFLDLEWHQRIRFQDAFNNPKTSPFRFDRSPQVCGRNRYGNIQPWDASRVKLKVPIGGSDYVNASPISLGSRSPTTSTKTGRSDTHISNTTTSDTPSSAVQSFGTRYIATQGPKDGQFTQFWTMVMQETVGPVGVIVMLTKCYEGNKEKCSQYFPTDMDNAVIILTGPEANGDDAEIGDPFMDSDPFSADANYMYADDVDSESPDVHIDGDEASESNLGSVRLLEMHTDLTSRSEVRRLKLEIGGESKEIYHYLFNGWPDFQKPEGEDRKALLELTRQSAARVGSVSNPRIVHCSAGVGRTGTFIALDFLLQELADGNLEVSGTRSESPAGKPGSLRGMDNNGSSGVATPEAREDIIYEVVNRLREQRMMMVMNDIQFSFLYEVVREAFVEKYMPRPGMSEAGVAGMEEPSPKLPKTHDLPFSSIYAGTNVANPPKADEDTVSDYGEPSQDNPYQAVVPAEVHEDGAGDLENV